MTFYFKTIDGELHLYREAGLFDEDLGKLSKTFTGKLETIHFFGENFVLEDISGFFCSGQKYRIKSSKGLNGVIEKNLFGGRYVLK